MRVFIVFLLCFPIFANEDTALDIHAEYQERINLIKDDIGRLQDEIADYKQEIKDLKAERDAEIKMVKSSEIEDLEKVDNSEEE